MNRSRTALPSIVARRALALTPACFAVLAATACAGQVAGSDPASATPEPAAPSAQSGSLRSQPPATSAAPVALSAEEMDRPENWVRAPGGFRVHPSCHHTVPAGYRVDADGNVSDGTGAFVEKLPACTHPILRDSARRDRPAGEPPSTNGWVEASWLNAGNIAGESFFDGVSGVLTVPQAPQANGLTDWQLVYLFNSLESLDAGGVIIQPVLQWGITCAAGCNGGQHWTLANWIVGGNFGTVESGITNNVLPSDRILLDIQMASPTEYFILYYNYRTGEENFLVANLTGNNADLKFDTAQPSVLEAYNVNGCAEYPQWVPGIVAEFQDIDVRQAGPQWNSFNLVDTNPATWGGGVWGTPNPSCGFGVMNFLQSGSATSWLMGS